jgi:hypothetical protein
VPINDDFILGDLLLLDLKEDCFGVILGSQAFGETFIVFNFAFFGVSFRGDTGFFSGEAGETITDSFFGDFGWTLGVTFGVI